MKNCLGQLLELIEPPWQHTVPAPPQLSVAVTLLVSGAGTWPAQLTIRLPGHVRLGGFASFTVMFWAQGALFPHKSASPYVPGMTNWPAQFLALFEAPFQITHTFPPQLSLATTLFVFGAGT